MDVKKIREILERGLDKDRHQKFSDATECMTTHRWYWRWAQDLESNCKDALAALSAIDLEAIRAEARAEALREAADRYCKNVCAWPSTELEHPDECECSQRYAILADEPKEERQGCFRCRNRPRLGMDSQLCHSCRLIVGHNYDPIPLADEPKKREAERMIKEDGQ